MDHSPRHELALKLLLSASLAVLVVGVAHAIRRHFEKPPRSLDAPHGVADREGGWQTKVHVMRSDSGAWPPTDDFNWDGMRDRTRTEVKPAGTRRIVCLGDGVTAGYGLRREQSYPSRLGALLEERGPGVEVMTVALTGGATRHEPIAYERIVRGYAPDLVLLGISLDDVQDLERDLVRPPGWFAWFDERSALIRKLVDADTGQIGSARDLVIDLEAPRVQEGYGRLFEGMRRLRAAVERDGAAFAVLVFPFADQVREEPMAATPQRTIEAFCARNRIPFLDLLPELHALGEAAFLPGDHLHLSAEGSALVAHGIASSGFVPPEWASASAVARALGPAAPPAPSPQDVPRLCGLLEKGDAQARREAAWSLGRIGPAARAAWPALAARLDDPAEAVRLEAARALGRGRAGEARGALFGAIADHRRAVRWAAADALAALGFEPTDAVGLVTALTSADPYVRAFAAWGIGEIGGVAGWTAPSLARRLEDTELGVRTAAAVALARVGNGDPLVVDALCRALRDPYWSERWRAAWTLGLLGTESVAAVPALTAALGDADERVRREAARALGRVGPEAGAALPMLVAARRDPSRGVREAAKVALDSLAGRMSRAGARSAAGGDGREVAPRPQ